MANGPNSSIGAVTDLGGKVVGALPASFLALCLVNIIFIGSIFWFEAKQTEARVAAVRPLLEACIQRLDVDRPRIPSSLSRETSP